jgi:hypothetical protein
MQELGLSLGSALPLQAKEEHDRGGNHSGSRHPADISVARGDRWYGICPIGLLEFAASVVIFGSDRGKDDRTSQDHNQRQ